MIGTRNLEWTVVPPGSKVPAMPLVAMARATPPWLLTLLLLLLLWALDTEVQKRVSLMGFGSHPRGVEPPSTRQLELQPAWDKGGILRPVQS